MLVRTFVYATCVLPLLLAAGCGGGGGGGGDSDDPPAGTVFRVETTDPRPGQATLSDEVNFEILFTAPVDPFSLDDPGGVRLVNLATGVEQPGELSLSLDAHTVTFNPQGRLALRTTYRLTVGQSIRNQQGTPLLAEFAANFTTGSVPAPALLRPSDFRIPPSRMQTGRSDHQATLIELDDARRFVLVTGGFTEGRSVPTGSAEILNVADLEPDKDDGFRFSSAGSFPMPRAYHTATAYRPGTGLVLVAGGGTGTLGTLAVADALVYSFTVNQFRDVPDMNIARRLHTATLIEGTGTDLDGKVLVAGGQPIGSAGDTAEIFDPNTETWTLLPARMHDLHEGHEAVLLKSGPLKGKVLITGGGTPIAEYFDPVTKTFVEIADETNSGRWMFGAVELSTSEVLLTDGGDLTAELFNPFTQTFSVLPSANRLERYAPVVHRFQFPAGRGPVSGGPSDNVLILGGATFRGGDEPWLAHASLEHFILGGALTGYHSSDPAYGGINLGDPRAFSAPVDLKDGRLLVTGGIYATGFGAPPTTKNLRSVLLFAPQPD